MNKIYFFVGGGKWYLLLGLQCRVKYCSSFSICFNLDLITEYFFINNPTKAQDVDNANK